MTGHTWMSDHMDEDLRKAFQSPGSLYRGAPLWSWNNRLDGDQLRRQIDCLKAMGMGGFHIHARTGLDTEYLGREFFERVKECRLYASEKGMLTWLYDEDRWPSGAAGGLVTREEAFRARHLLFTAKPYGKGSSGASGVCSTAEGHRTGNGRLLAIYKVILEKGCLASYQRICEEDVPVDGGQVWYAYLEVSQPSSWFNGQTYVDALNPKAIERFIEVTHERYYEELGEHFGRDIPAIFTDEPQFTHKQRLMRAESPQDVVLPWTDDLQETFFKHYGGDLLARLPEILWELPNGSASVWRYRYHDHVCERFTQAFSDTIGQWCDRHGIALTGHMMAEHSLDSQTSALGETMRGYRAFNLPGIDVLLDRVEEEFGTAKQAQSVARQSGRRGVLSELYGVTNWNFDFPGHKRQGDWQAALGVTHRVHHLAHVSLAGEAKRDYPAPINYQSPWHAEYPVVEDHFARVSLMMTAGKPRVRIGVIHPIESYWLAFGPMDQTGGECAEREGQFRNMIQWLLYGFLDFDFICESLLPDQSNDPKQGGFAVGEMEYDVILVPNLRTIRSTTLARLEAFVAAGGRVFFVGDVPALVDAGLSAAPAALAQRCKKLPFSASSLRSALDPHRDVGLLDAQGLQVEGCLYQLRQDGGERTLFLCNTDRHKSKCLIRELISPHPTFAGLTLSVAGEWKFDLLDTSTGEIRPLAASYRDGMSLLPCEIEAHGHLLLRLIPGCRKTGESISLQAKEEVARLRGPVPISLSEPNVLLLDRARYRVNEEDWQHATHVLQIDPRIHERLGMPAVGGSMAQPWTDREPVSTAAKVSLLYKIESRIAVVSPLLALENLAGTVIIFDGKQAASKPVGYFTDEAIQTVEMPNFEAGSHTLELVIDYNRKTSIEWCYILGDFGVEVRGDCAVITGPVRELSFGDWTTQGLPFYAGNVTYHCSLPVGGEALDLRVNHFAGPLVTVDSKGLRMPLAFAPHRAKLGAVKEGEAIDLTVFGHRGNAFGQLHGMDAGPWWGPESWRTNGDQWADEYQLFPMGLLTAPLLEKDSEIRSFATESGCMKPD